MDAAAVPTYPDLPTGVGFCLYLRRAMLDAVGLFDPAFGLGYGEENDLCLRAARAGWRNLLADNAFVVHTGGRSFVGQKAELGYSNEQDYNLPQRSVFALWTHSLFPKHCLGIVELLRSSAKGDTSSWSVEVAFEDLKICKAAAEKMANISQRD